MPDLMTLSEIEAASGWADRSALNRLIGIPEVKEWLEGEGKPTRYPESSVPKFQNLLTLKEKGLTPKAIAVAVKEMSGAPLVAPSMPTNGDETALVPVAQQLAQMTLPEAQNAGRAIAAELAQAFVHALKEANMMPSPAEDRFIGREEAAMLLHCSPTAVGRRVRPVSKDVWSFLMIQEHMAEARKKAQEKPQKARRKAEKPSDE